MDVDRVSVHTLRPRRRPPLPLGLGRPWAPLERVAVGLLHVVPAARVFSARFPVARPLRTPFLAEFRDAPPRRPRDLDDRSLSPSDVLSGWLSMDPSSALSGPRPDVDLPLGYECGRLPSLWSRRGERLRPARPVAASRSALSEFPPPRDLFLSVAASMGELRRSDLPRGFPPFMLLQWDYPRLHRSPPTYFWPETFSL